MFQILSEAANNLLLTLWETFIIIIWLINSERTRWRYPACLWFPAVSHKKTWSLTINIIMFKFVWSRWLYCAIYSWSLSLYLESVSVDKHASKKARSIPSHFDLRLSQVNPFVWLHNSISFDYLMGLFCVVRSNICSPWLSFSWNMMNKQIYVMKLYIIAFREVPSCVNTVTFCQFLFIAVEGFIFTANFGFKKPVIPIRYRYIYLITFSEGRGQGRGGVGRVGEGGRKWGPKGLIVLPCRLVVPVWR